MERLAEEKRFAEEVEKQRAATQKAKSEHLSKIKLETERLAEEKLLANNRENAEKKAKEKPERSVSEKIIDQSQKKPTEAIRAENKPKTQVISFIRQRLLARSGASLGIVVGVLVVFIVGFALSSRFKTTSTPNQSPTATNSQSLSLTFTPATQLVTALPVPIGTPVIESSDAPKITSETVTKLTELYTLDSSDQFMIAVSNDFKHVVLQSYSDDTSVSLWDLTTGKQLATLTAPASILAVAISPNNNFIAAGSGDKNIYLWDSRGELINILSGHVNDVSSVAFSPKGDFLASGSYDTTINLWEVRSGNLFRTFNGHTGSVTKLNFSSDGQSIISGSNDHSVRLWTTEEITFEKIFLTGGSNAIPAFWTSKNGDTLITVDNVSGSDIARLWDISTATKIAEYRGFNFALSPDGDRIAFVAIDESKNTQVGDKTIIGRESTIRVEKIGGDETVILTGCVGSNVNDMTFSPDGTLIVTNDYGTGLCLRDATDGTVIKEIELSSFTSSLMFNADGSALLAWGGIITEIGLKP